MLNMLEEASKRIGIELAGIVPQDSKISEYNFLGKPLSELTDSDAYHAVENIARKIGLVNHN